MENLFNCFCQRSNIRLFDPKRVLNERYDKKLIYMWVWVQLYVSWEKKFQRGLKPLPPPRSDAKTGVNQQPDTAPWGENSCRRLAALGGGSGVLWNGLLVQ